MPIVFTCIHIFKLMFAQFWKTRSKIRNALYLIYENQVSLTGITKYAIENGMKFVRIHLWNVITKTITRYIITSGPKSKLQLYT